MSGCGGGSCGITKVREAERERARRAVIHAYGRRAEQARSAARVERAPEPIDLAALGRTFEEALPVRAFVAEAEPDDLARWLYLLVGLHEPSLWELREGVARSTPSRAEETYVRVGLSAIGRYATLQECVLDATEDRNLLLVRESPRLGVTDTRLRKVVTCAQGVTRSAGLVLLDIAFLVEPAPAALRDDASILARFGREPTMWSLLFDPAPPTTTREVAVAPPRAREARLRPSL